MKHNKIKSVDMVAKGGRPEEDCLKEALVYAIENGVNVELEHNRVHQIYYKELMEFVKHREDWERVRDLPF